MIWSGDGLAEITEFKGLGTCSPDIARTNWWLLYMRAVEPGLGFHTDSSFDAKECDM